MEERQQFARSDEAWDERTGVGADHTVKRLEREREVSSTGDRSIRVKVQSEVQGPQVQDPFHTTDIPVH